MMLHNRGTFIVLPIIGLKLLRLEFAYLPKHSYCMFLWFICCSIIVSVYVRLFESNADPYTPDLEDRVSVLCLEREIILLLPFLNEYFFLS